MPPVDRPGIPGTQVQILVEFIDSAEDPETAMQDIMVTEE